MASGGDELNKRTNVSRVALKPTSLAKKDGEKSSDGILRMLLHDIQNHLQAIRMEIDLLDLESKHQFDFGRIANAIDRASLSIQDVGDYFSSQELSLSHEHVDCIVEDVVSEFQNVFLEQGINVRLVNRQSLPLVSVDADQLRSALQRILDFCKNLLPGGGELEIEELALWQHENHTVEVRFRIFSPAPFAFDGDDLFGPFFRVNGNKIGSGMVLAKEILKRFHAQLFFAKTFPECATITIKMTPISR